MNMNKRMREIKEKMDAKVLEARALLDGENKDVEKSTKLMNEVDELKKEFDLEKRLFDLDQEEAKDASDKQAEKKAEKDSTKKFAKAVRAMVRKDVTPMTEGVDADGGYTVPVDISTKINEYPSAEFSVEPYITTETVSTNKGARTYEKKSAVTPFAPVDEGGAIPPVATPKFERKTYAIGDMGGYVPITNDLLDDSDTNLEAYLVGKLRDKEIATINSEFFTAMTATGGEGQQTAPEDIASINDIKKIINVTIGSAYDSQIMVNDDGWNWLDCLEDKNGRPLLTPYGDSNNRVGELSVGGSIINVIRVPNKVWASTATHMPIIIGDTKAAFRRFDRQQLKLMISNVASVAGFNAFEQNGALIRAIMRDDAKIWDKDAFVYGQIAFPEETDGTDEG
nr:phage major capsid protein [uncultured Ruminococcus sp.]